MVLLFQGSIALSEVLKLAFVSRTGLYKPIKKNGTRDLHVPNESINLLAPELFF